METEATKELREIKNEIVSQFSSIREFFNWLMGEQEKRKADGEVFVTLQ